MKNYLSIFCIFLVLGFSALSCRAEGAVSSGTGEIESPLLEPAEEGNPSRQLVLVLDLEGGRDIISASYLDPEFRDGVLAFFHELTGSLDVAELVLSYAIAQDIDPALAFSLCAEESSFRPRAINHNRNGTVDRGLFQLNSASFPNLTITEFFDIETNVRYGVSHLRWCLDTAGSQVAGLAMYNAGAARVRSTGTPESTLDYICRILNRKQNIEEQFLLEYLRMVKIDTVYGTPFHEEPEKTPLRLSLLAPLKGR